MRVRNVNRETLNMINRDVKLIVTRKIDNSSGVKRLVSKQTFVLTRTVNINSCTPFRVLWSNSTQ